MLEHLGGDLWQYVRQLGFNHLLLDEVLVHQVVDGILDLQQQRDRVTCTLSGI